MRGLTSAFQTLTRAMWLGVRNWADTFLLCVKKHFIFQASTISSPGQGQIFSFVPTWGSQQSDLSKWGECHFEEKITICGLLLEESHLPPANFYVLLLFTKQKEGNMKRAEGSLDFSEDNKSCTGSCKTLITSYRLQSCSFYLINESKQKSNMWQTNHEGRASLTYHSGRTIIKVLWRANRRDVFSLIIQEDAYKSQKLLKF